MPLIVGILVVGIGFYALFGWIMTCWHLRKLSDTASTKIRSLAAGHSVFVGFPRSEKLQKNFFGEDVVALEWNSADEYYQKMFFSQKGNYANSRPRRAFYGSLGCLNFWVVDDSRAVKIKTSDLKLYGQWKSLMWSKVPESGKAIVLNSLDEKKNFAFSFDVIFYRELRPDMYLTLMGNFMPETESNTLELQGTSYKIEGHFEKTHAWIGKAQIKKGLLIFQFFAYSGIILYGTLIIWAFLKQ